MKKIILGTTLIMLCLFMIACASKESTRVNLEGVLSQSTCNPPCWLEMTPGKTTVEEVRQLLTAYPNVIDQETIFDYEPVKAYLAHIGWKVKNSEISGSVSFKTDYIDRIGLSTDKGTMELEKAIQMFGAPEKVTYMYSYCKGGIIGDSMCIRVSLLYPQKGVKLSYEQRGNEYNYLIISPSQQIDSVLFFDPEVGPYSSRLEISEENQIFDWVGYSEIDIQD